MINGIGIVGFRDPFGIRPLILGSKDSDLIGNDYMVASESTVLESLGFEVMDDIEAGSAVFINSEGEMEIESCIKNPVPTPCIFEYVYLARPDATIDNISVHKSRLRMGEYLAQKILREKPNHDIDVVIPIPDSSTTSALQLASTLGIKYREGFVKNRYIGRTFIMPFQEKREKSVRQKLNAIDLEFKDKVVLLVDDSIVRGTTSVKIVEMLRNSGVKKIHMRIASPPVKYPCYYGIDTPTKKELLASRYTIKEITDYIGVDSLKFISLDGIYKALGFKKGRDKNKPKFTDHYFSGDYPVELIDQKSGGKPSQLSLLIEAK